MEAVRHPEAERASAKAASLVPCATSAFLTFTALPALLVLIAALAVHAMVVELQAGRGSVSVPQDSTGQTVTSVQPITGDHHALLVPCATLLAASVTMAALVVASASARATSVGPHAAPATGTTQERTVINVSLPSGVPLAQPALPATLMVALAALVSLAVGSACVLDPLRDPPAAAVFLVPTVDSARHALPAVPTATVMMASLARASASAQVATAALTATLLPLRPLLPLPRPTCHRLLPQPQVVWTQQQQVASLQWLSY